jgi:hypothetical protein
MTQPRVTGLPAGVSDHASHASCWVLRGWGAREIEQVRERLLVGRLAGGLELIVEVFQEVRPVDDGQLHLDGLTERRLVGVLEHHLQRIADRSGEEQRDVIGARAHQRRADDRQRLARTMPEPLELIEDDHEVLRQRAKADELRVQRLGVMLGLRSRASHRPLDDLDVEADLLLERADLALRGAPEMLDRMADHRIVNASDEPRDAHHPLQVDLDHVKRRCIIAV